MTLQEAVRVWFRWFKGYIQSVPAYSSKLMRGCSSDVLMVGSSDVDGGAAIDKKIDSYIYMAAW